MNTFLSHLAEKIKNLDLKTQYAILAALLLVVFLFNYFLITRPEANALKKMSDGQQDIRNEIIRLENDTKRLNQLKVDFKAHQKQLDDPRIKFRSRSDIPALIEEMKKFAENFDVNVDQLVELEQAQELLLTNATGKYWAVPLSLEARAGYHSLGKWLNQLERERLLLNVKNISISADEKNTVYHQVQAVLRVVVVEAAPAKSKP